MYVMCQLVHVWCIVQRCFAEGHFLAQIIAQHEEYCFDMRQYDATKRQMYLNTHLALSGCQFYAHTDHAMSGTF